jgi:uncharacterized DUF497 family protein
MPAKQELTSRSIKLVLKKQRQYSMTPHLVTYPDDFHSDREDRYISIGYSTRNRILLAVHTEYQETAEILIIRIISSRKATPTERKFYEED